VKNVQWIITIITFAKKEGYVLAGIYLIVCLAFYQQLHIKNYWSDLHENFTRDVSVNMEERIKFGKFICVWVRFLKGSST